MNKIVFIFLVTILSVFSFASCEDDLPPDACRACYGRGFIIGCDYCNSDLWTNKGYIDCTWCENGIKKCPFCDYGYIEGELCHVCNGNYYEICDYCYGRGETKCPFCNARQHICEECNGTGKIQDTII